MLDPHGLKQCLARGYSINTCRMKAWGGLWVGWLWLWPSQPKSSSIGRHNSSNVVDESQVWTSGRPRDKGHCILKLHRELVHGMESAPAWLGDLSLWPQSLCWWRSLDLRVMGPWSVALDSAVRAGQTWTFSPPQECHCVCSNSVWDV